MLTIFCFYKSWKHCKFLIQMGLFSSLLPFVVVHHKYCEENGNLTFLCRLSKLLKNVGEVHFTLHSISYSFILFQFFEIWKRKGNSSIWFAPTCNEQKICKNGKTNQKWCKEHLSKLCHLILFFSKVGSTGRKSLFNFLEAFALLLLDTWEI